MRQLHRLYGYFLFHRAWAYAERVYQEMERRRTRQAWLYLQEAT
jgi:hypothetical protein